MKYQRSIKDAMREQLAGNKKSKVSSFDVSVSDNGGFSVRVRQKSTKNEPYSDGKTHVYPDAATLCTWIEKTFSK